jgi:EAL domain-containing protein (putative c-di-GMP-specific phosphodiesterase class I)
LSADEFAILTQVAETADAGAIAAQTVAAVREPVRLSGLLMEVTASAGLAVHDDPGDDFVAVLRHADSAMHEAKRRGNDVVVYHDQPGYSSAEGVKLLSDFREALNAGDTRVALHYQPQASLGTRTIEGLEALLRWTHPVHGQIDAATILGLAEQTTVMNLLTRRVISDVIGQAARWREQGLTTRVAINISARDLYSESIVDQLAERLSYHQLPSHLFQVEVTESALTTDPVRARATLRQVADLGIDISLDDFGTGFSSLQQIRGTPLAEIKIDQSFVKGMARNRDDAAIVASTINLAHSLGLRTVAEGVEDEATLIRLTELGCTLAQGWHISRPVPADRVPSLIPNPGAV